MKKLLFFFLYLITYTQCSECQTKSSLSQGEDGSQCNSLSTSSEEYSCFYDEGTGGCVEKTCENLRAPYCSYFRETSDNKRCFEKSDGSCTLKSCSDFPISECSRFGYKEGKICLPNSDNSRCFLLVCEELHSNCENYYSGFSDEKCVLKSNGSGCEIIKCSDLTTVKFCQ